MQGGLRWQREEGQAEWGRKAHREELPIEGERVLHSPFQRQSDSRKGEAMQFLKQRGGCMHPRAWGDGRRGQDRARLGGTSGAHLLSLRQTLTLILASDTDDVRARIVAAKLPP